MNEPRPGSLEYWAREQPDEPAMIEGDRVVTWKAWNDEADRLAEGLSRLGLAAGDVLVTRMQIRPEWPITSAAAAKLGCRILGLNWRLTPTETRYVLSNSGAHAILCDDVDPGALTAAFEGLELKFAVSIDAPAEGFTPYPSLIEEAPAKPRVSEGNPPLILYTSGTTGLPKGVVMGARGDQDNPKVRQEMLEYQQSVAASRPQVRGDIQMIALPMHHGAGPGSVWGSQARGNTMVMLRRFDPEEALRLIEKHRVSVWTGVPTMYKRLAALPPRVLARYDVSSIRMLGVGAAPVPFSLKEWIIDHFGPVLGEGYGATETGMLTALSPEMQTKKPGSSGLPHKHVYIRIRSEAGEELAPGEAGEIWVKTPAVIAGYLNARPLGADTLDAEGFFRTGDVGRVDEDGYLFITDRAKDMIVSGGVNIYPAEIEAAIIRHPAVQDVAVIGIPDEEFGEQVKAFCELKPGRDADPAEILAHCAETLASYKRPKSLEIVAELPRNTMGKLLKRELRDPYWKGRGEKRMTDILDLAGRVALVTGAGQGVGRQIALHLAAHNAGGVVVNDYVLERAEAVAEEVRAAGGKALPLQADVSDHANVKDMVAKAVSDLGPIGVLVNNAGNAGANPSPELRKPFWESGPDVWNSFIGVNLYGVMNCTAAVIPGMIAREAPGRIVTIISDAGRWGDASLEPYAAAKAGAAGFMRSVARTLGRHQITANSVAIALTATPAVERTLRGDPERLKRQMEKYIIRRPGRPDDIANMVLFLASDASSWITGQVYPVNGGFTLAL